MIALVDQPRTETTYNLEVDEFHTYFVGKMGAWVHNQGNCRDCGLDLNEHYLRDANGDIVYDKTTGEARRVEHVVIESGDVIDVVETTSLTADQSSQIAKEKRIQQQGGNYFQDKETGCVIPFNCEIRIQRRD